MRRARRARARCLLAVHRVRRAIPYPRRIHHCICPEALLHVSAQQHSARHRNEHAPPALYMPNLFMHVASASLPGDLLLGQPHLKLVAQHLGAVVGAQDFELSPHVPHVEGAAIDQARGSVRCTRVDHDVTSGHVHESDSVVALVDGARHTILAPHIHLNHLMRPRYLLPRLAHVHPSHLAPRAVRAHAHFLRHRCHRDVP